MSPREIIDDAMARAEMDLEQLAERLGKKIRTMKAIRSGEIPMAEDVKLHIKDLVALSEMHRSKQKKSAGKGRKAVDYTKGPRGLLRARRLELGLTLEEVAERTGCEKSVIRELEEGNGHGDERVLALLAEGLDLPAERPLDGTMPPAGYDGGIRPHTDGGSGLTVRAIPLLSWAQAGELEDWEVLFNPTEIIAYNCRDPKALAVTIRGDAMEPDYREGTIAIIYPCSQARNGDLVLARLSDGSMLFKRLQINGDQLTFVSLNPVYPPIVVERSKVERLAPVGLTQRVEL